MTSLLYDSNDPEFYLCYAQTCLYGAELWLKKCRRKPGCNNDYLDAEELIKGMETNNRLIDRKAMLKQVLDKLYSIHCIIPKIEEEETFELRNTTSGITP